MPGLVCPDGGETFIIFERRAVHVGKVCPNWTAPSGCFFDRHAKTREISSPANRFAYDSVSSGQMPRYYTRLTRQRVRPFVVAASRQRRTHLPVRVFVRLVSTVGFVLFRSILAVFVQTTPHCPDSRNRTHGTVLLPIKRGEKSRKRRSRHTVRPFRSHDTKHTFEILHVADVTIAIVRPEGVIRNPL